VLTEPNESGEPQRKLDAVIAAYLGAEDAGQAPDRGELLAQHADLAAELQSFFADHDRMQPLKAVGRLAPELALGGITVADPTGPGGPADAWPVGPGSVVGGY
jgi:hypothetical protein